MNYFDFIITKPILWLIEICYKIVPNYALALILFAIIIRVIIFPFSYWSQIQAVKMAKMKPQLDDIKAYCSDDWRVLLREQKKLYKKEKYSSLVSMLPLLLQIPIIVGVIRGLEEANILSNVPDNLFIPLFAGLSAFALSYVQNLSNVLAKDMGFFAKWGLAIFLTIFSLYFSLTSGIGFGIYWISGNILGIFVQLLCNILYNPKKYITYKITVKIKINKEQKKREKIQEKNDMKKFMSTKKNLVFYSEKSGFYKYYEGMINYLLENSKVKIHYLTSDINDEIFENKNPRIIPYYCGFHKLIVIMMKLDCKVMVMTMPDLQKYQYKRSIVNKNIEYIYTDHGFGSLTLQFRKNAFDYYDTIFCSGPHYNKEIRIMEKYYNSKEKNLIDTGFSFFNNLANNFNNNLEKKEIKKIIIAPSWQKDNIFELCLDDLMSSLSKENFEVILRPHPEFIKRFPNKIEEMKQKYGNEFQLDFSVNIMDADLIVTDWSSIAFEYTIVTNRPCLFINTPMKVLNEDWNKFGIEPIEVTLRDKIGVSINLDEFDNIISKINSLNNIKEPRKIIQEMMYDNSKADEVACEYILRSLRGK